MLVLICKSCKVGMVVIIDDISCMVCDVCNYFDLKEFIFCVGVMLEFFFIEFGLDFDSIFIEYLLVSVV